MREQIRPGLGLVPAEIGPGFKFHEFITGQIDHLRKAKAQRLPIFLATCVIDLPHTQQEWERLHITPRPEGNLYQSIVLSIFGEASRSPHHTSEFLSLLDSRKEVIDKKLGPDFPDVIAGSVFMLQEANPSAVAQIVAWAADERVPARERASIRARIMSYHLPDRPLDELRALVTALDENGQYLLANRIRRFIEDKEEPLRMTLSDQLFERY